MSEMELLMVGISMILATAIVRCLEGLYHATTSPRRYWIPQVLLWSTFIYSINFLWAYKNNLSQDSPSYFLYACSILAASTFVLRTHVLASKDAAQIDDWALHFQKAARPYFIFAALTSIFTLGLASAVGETNGFDVVSISFWLGVGLNMTGAIFNRNWVRGAAAIAHLSLVVVASYLLFTNDLI